MTKFYQLNKKEVDNRYKIFKSKVNMSYEDMLIWKKNKCAHAASIKVNEVINRVTRLLNKNKTDWTHKDYVDAGKVISYISRASKIKDSSKPANKKLGCPKGKNFYALRNWAYDRNKEKRKNPNSLQKHKYYWIKFTNSKFGYCLNLYYIIYLVDVLESDKGYRSNTKEYILKYPHSDTLFSLLPHEIRIIKGPYNTHEDAINDGIYK